MCTERVAIRHCFQNAIVLALLLFVVAACSTTTATRIPVPEDLAEQVQVSNESLFRFWGDEEPDDMEERLASLKQIYAANPPIRSEDWNMLALSGGGSDGAFGAGLLVGWTQRGTRPTFRVVTGISIGSIIAPFAYLGPDYDDELREIFTTLSTDQVAKKNVLAGLLGGSALADVTGMEQLIARYATAEVLAAIAEESRRGRILLIGTTNLDAQRPVIWSISQIALSDYPDKVALFQKIIQASAAIPGAFPPVSIEVEAEGASYTELHVDGGVANQVFAYPPQFSREHIDEVIGHTPRRRLFIIRNGKVTPEYSVTRDELLPIAGRSISTLIKTQGVGDLYRLYTQAERDKLDFNLAFIPPEFTQVSQEAFDNAYMRALFDLGYELGRSGDPWHKKPPGVNDR